MPLCIPLSPPPPSPPGAAVKIEAYRPASFHSGVYTIMTLPTALSHDGGIISFIHLSLLPSLHPPQEPESRNKWKCRRAWLGAERRSSGSVQMLHLHIFILRLVKIARPRPLELASFCLPLLLRLHSVWALEKPGALLLLDIKSTNWMEKDVCTFPVGGKQDTTVCFPVNTDNISWSLSKAFC